MNIPFANSFQGRSVFVTGHTGFKGSWLVTWLRQLGARITGFSQPPLTVPNNFDVSNIKGIMAAHHVGDIRDSLSLRQALRMASPDIVFHLAAQALVRESYTSPRETFDTNVMGTLSLLDCIRELAKPCVLILVTSDKCYNNREQAWGYRECDEMGGFDPYSASKGAMELLSSSYRDSFFPPARVRDHGVKVATVRAGNVIGGGDWAKDRILTDAVKALSESQTVSVRSPNAVRPWQHVLEPLSGYLSLGAQLLQSDDASLCSGWNFGPLPGQEATVATLMNDFCKAWGNGRWVDASATNRPHEAAVLKLCIDKALWNLKWRPRWDLAQAITRTALWYRKYYSKPSASMYDVCLEDIAHYSNS
jgi:CDP-glucose 4,6-dehydratase